MKISQSEFVQLMSEGNVTLNDFQRYDLHCKSFQCNMPLRKMVDLTKFRQHHCEILNSNKKTCNVLHLFRICRKLFAVTCHITLIFVATSYHSKSSEKIVQCNISLTKEGCRTSEYSFLLSFLVCQFFSHQLHCLNYSDSGCIHLG